MKKIFIPLMCLALLLNPCMVSADFTEITPAEGEAQNLGRAASRYSIAASDSISESDGVSVASTLPTKYDSRDYISTFPVVRNQGTNGDCWAYASTAAAEISLLNNGGNLFTFSELHMADNVYYDESNPWSFDVTSGGNRETAAAYFARGSGPVVDYDSEAEHEYKADIADDLAAYVNTIQFLPDAELYVAYSLYTDESVGGTHLFDDRYTIVGKTIDENVITVLNDEGEYETVTCNEYDIIDTAEEYYTTFYHIGKYERDLEIKEAIMEYGSVFSSYYADPDNVNLNLENSAYYYSYSTGVYGDQYPYAYIEEINHAINIIGWDDDYPKENFNEEPPGNGAWIVRNSWGDNVLDEGYFYISYYDSTIGDNSAVFTDVETEPDFDRIYQYDPFGQTSYFEMPSGTALANRYDKQGTGDEYITEVGVYINSANTTVDIAVNSYTSDGDYQYIVWYDESSEKSVRNYASSHGCLFREDYPAAASIKTQTFELPGYYVITLDEPVKIEGDSFDVAVSYSSADGSDVRVSVESAVDGYSSNAEVNANESYWWTSELSLQSSGKTVALVEGWNEISDSSGTLYNACIKVMTVEEENGGDDSDDDDKGGDTDETVFSGGILCDEGGNIIRDDDGNASIEVTVSGEYFTSGNEEKKLIMVGGNSGGLYCFSDIQSVANGETVTFTLPSGYSEARIFLWEDMITLKPLADPIVIEAASASE